MSDDNKNKIVPPNGNRKGLVPSFSNGSKLATNIPPRGNNLHLNQMVNDEDEEELDENKNLSNNLYEDSYSREKRQKVIEEVGKELEDNIEKEEKKKKKHKKDKDKDKDKDKNSKEKDDKNDSKHDGKDDSKSSDTAKQVGKFFKKKKNKWKFIAIGVCAGIFLLLFLVLFIVLSGEGGGRATNQDMIEETMNNTGENSMTEDEKAKYKAPYWDCEGGTDSDVCQEGKISQNFVEFYDRFDRLYDEYEKKGLDKLKLEDTKYHVLATAFFDYAPEQVNDDINNKAPMGEIDNLYGETGGIAICDDEYQTSGACNSINDESYNKDNVLSISDEATKNEYLADNDTLRQLLRQFTVYNGVCKLEQTVECSEGEEGCVCTECHSSEYCVPHCEKKISTETTNETFSFWEYMSVILGEILTLGIGRTPGEKTCSDIANAGGWTSSYEINEDIDFCAYYEWLYESDYLDNRTHLKDSFAQLEDYALETGQDLETLKQKTRLVYINEIIADATYASNKQPIESNQITGGYNTYTLSDSIYITVTSDNPNKATGSYPLDQYVEGVLVAEVGYFWHHRNASHINASVDQVVETWRANAIAIRSYTLARTKNATKPIVNSSAAQNFSDDYLNSQTDQALAMREAAMSTAGQILTLNGEPLMAEYDSFCKKSANGYNCNGSVCSVTYTRKGGDLTHVISIPAAYEKHLSGGHCRGMSQWHGYYMVTQGKTHQELLAYYYDPNVQLAQLDYETGGMVYTSLGGATTSINQWPGEAVLTCKYGIQIPLRVAGVEASTGSSGSESGSSGTTTYLDPAKLTDLSFNQKVLETVFEMAPEQKVIGQCSALVSEVLERTYDKLQLGKSPSGRAQTLYAYFKNNGMLIENVSDIQPGDILFWDKRNTSNDKDYGDHVAIFVAYGTIENGEIIEDPTKSNIIVYESNTKQSKAVVPGNSDSIGAIVDNWDLDSNQSGSWWFLGAARGYVEK